MQLCSHCNEVCGSQVQVRVIRTRSLGYSRRGREGTRMFLRERKVEDDRMPTCKVSDVLQSSHCHTENDHSPEYDPIEQQHTHVSQRPFRYHSLHFASMDFVTQNIVMSQFQ